MSEHSSSGGAKLPDLNEDAADDWPIDYLFDSERRQMINTINLDSHDPFRRDSINWILERHGHYGFSPATAHVAVAYFDRFMSNYSIPAADGWRYRILSVACLSVAAQVEEPREALSKVKDLQGYVPSLTTPTVLEMEFEVMARFQMDLRRVTPFDFQDYFISPLSLLLLPRPADHVAVNFTDLVMITIRAGDFVRFLPSEVAAAAVILVAGRNVALPDLFYERVNKVRVRSCRRQLEGYLPEPCPCVDCVAPPAAPVAVVQDSVIPTAGDNRKDVKLPEGPLKKRRRFRNPDEA